jgi:hypothetical protein
VFGGCWTAGIGDEIQRGGRFHGPNLETLRLWPREIRLRMALSVVCYASPMLDFSWDSRDLKMWRGKAVDKALARALRLAGNAALRAMQGQSVEEVQRKKLMKESAIRDGTPMDKPGSRVEIRALTWKMRISGKAIPLGKFLHQRGPLGVSVAVNRGGGRKLIRGAFVATMKSGRKGIFLRRGKARLPIDELYSSKISDVMSDRGTIPRVQGQALFVMEKTFAKGLDRELKKLRRSGNA